MRAVCLCVDVEPSARQLGNDAPRRWAGWEQVHQWVEQLRPEVQDRTGHPLQVSWFLRADPQVAGVYGSATHAFAAHHDLVSSARSAGDCFGVHPHAWRRQASGRWVDDQGDAAWIETCLKTSLSAFAEATGEPCRLVRMGNRFMSDDLAACLDENGVVVDLSVEPSRSPGPAPTDADVTGARPDYRRVPRTPYRPAVADFRRAARRSEPARDVVFLPLATAPVRQQRGVIPRLSAVRRRGWAGRADQTVTLRQLGADRATARRAVGAMLGRGDHPLVFAVRADWDDQPTSQPLVETAVRALLDHPDGAGLRFVGPEEAVQPFGGGR